MKKNQDIENYVKLKVIVSNQGAFEKRLFLCAKHMGSWLSIRGTTVTSIVLAAKKFCGFYVLVTTLILPIPKTNVTVAYKPFQCFTRWAALMEESSSHVTTRYVTKSSTSQNNLSPLTAYTYNP